MIWCCRWVGRWSRSGRRLDRPLLRRRTGGVAARFCLSGVPDEKKDAPKRVFFLLLAERTGLEPATPGVTGRYSNQLNYHSESVLLEFCAAAVRLPGGC